jgi:hypothetical protein
MQVETFEAIGLEVDAQGGVTSELNDPEAMALVESLGLEGQKRFTVVTPAGEEETVARMPYRRLTAEERAVYGACFPAHSKVAAYTQAPLPLRVLQVVAHAVTMFDALEVWHPAEVADDPVLIGVKFRDGKDYLRDEYLLARWGEVLVPFEELRAKAKTVLMAKAREALASSKADLAAFEGALEQLVDTFLLGQRSHRHTCHASVSITA